MSDVDICVVPVVQRKLRSSMTNSQSYDDTYLQDKLTVTDHLNFILSINPVMDKILSNQKASCVVGGGLQKFI